MVSKERGGNPTAVHSFMQKPSMALRITKLVLTSEEDQITFRFAAGPRQLDSCMGHFHFLPGDDSNCSWALHPLIPYYWLARRQDLFEFYQLLRNCEVRCTCTMGRMHLTLFSRFLLAIASPFTFVSYIWACRQQIPPPLSAACLPCLSVPSAAHARTALADLKLACDFAECVGFRVTEMAQFR